MKCPRCQSSNTQKDGHQNGKQRWECKDCGCILRDSYSTKGYHPQVKQICLNMYLNGMGFRGIERVTGIHHTTIINWVKESGEVVLFMPTSTRVEGENTRLRHTCGLSLCLARLHRATLCYSKSIQMLKYSVRLLMHYLRFKQIPIPA